MDDTTSTNGFHLGAMASLLLQGATAFMVYQVFSSQSAGTRESRSKTAGIEEEKKQDPQDAQIQSNVTTKKATVTASEERSIRGTNIYGPYKKVSYFVVGIVLVVVGWGCWSVRLWIELPWIQKWDFPLDSLTPLTHTHCPLIIEYINTLEESSQ